MPQFPFAFSRQTAQVDEEIQARAARRSSGLRQQFISSSNIYKMKHGTQWQSLSGDSDRPTKMTTHSTEISISNKRIVNHDLTQLLEFLDQMSDKSHQLFLEALIQTMNETTNETGNIVRGKEIKVALEEMLSKLQFGVDRYGTPSAPQMLVPPSIMRQIEELAQTPDIEYEERVALITERKKSEAFADETRRISRYRLPR